MELDVKNIMDFLGFFVRVGVILAFVFSQLMADSADSKTRSAPPHLNKRTLGSENHKFLRLAQAESQSNSNSDSTHHLHHPSAMEGESNTESTQDSSIDSQDLHKSTTDSYTDSQDSQDSYTDSQDSHELHDDYEIIDIGTSTIRAKAEFEAYQSGNQIGREMLDSNPSGNGDITSILKILPNVQFDNAQLKSTTPGEIDPANVSISGGLFYQNNFQLDGFNMNNDLDPNGGTSNGPDSIRGGRSQGLNIDTSLLESITVLDSNVSASYGGFSGGVVEANVRKPRTDGWHGNFSYQHTADYFTQYFIDERQESNFYTSSDENYQPKFHKHLIRANTEGYITNDLGLVASFTTTQSFIPLQAYSTMATNKGGTENNSTRTQKRQSYNAFVKAHYNPTDNLTLEANLAYIPQFNSYYNAVAKNSYYEMRSGGWQSGLKALWQAPLGLWSNTLGYSYLQNSRKSEADYFMSWYASSEKNWAINSANRANEGGYGDMDQLQHSLNYKSDFAFDTINLGKFKHDLRVGAEIIYQSLAKNRLNDYIGFNNPVPIKAGQNCPNTPDNLGLWSCSNAKPTSKPSGTAWNDYDTSQGQYFNSISIYREAGKVEFDNIAYGVFAEDEITLDFERTGSVKARLGLRIDGDSYMDKITLAPRFAMNYISPAPKEWHTTITFGANRYYGRNLFSYRLYDYNQRFTKKFSRNAPSESWSETPNNTSTSPYKFNQLNVPYSDELMGAITQNLDIFSVGVKYIHRNGKDEIMRLRRSDLNLPNESGYANNYTTWTNDGASESHIISLIVQNLKPIQTFGIHHYYLFAFDYTKTQRSYNLYSSDDAYYDNKDIMYNGQIIKYRDRPVENYALPFTIRLNTTHSFDIGRTKWLLNNFFRYKAGYDRMVFINKTHPDYNNAFKGDQYGKMHFKGTFGWDMRVGFEVDFYKSQAWKHTLYVNVDIYNVLNLKNMTTLSGVSGAISSFASTSSIPVYEVGRQFWCQVGYKF